MESVGSRSRTQIDMRAAGGTLLRIVHGSIHAKLLNGFRRGAWECFADGKIDGSGALNRLRSELAAPLTPVLFTTRAEATWLVLFPLNRLLASTPFNRNVLLVSRWPLAQIGSVAQTRD